jgi:hypothetical protein
MHGFLSWREIYLVFAAMNLAVCLPVHLALARLTTSAVSASKATPPTAALPRSAHRREQEPPLLPDAVRLRHRRIRAVRHPRSHGPADPGAGYGRRRALVVASLFGPSQVASRLINLVFGRELPQKMAGGDRHGLLIPLRSG